MTKFDNKQIKGSTVVLKEYENINQALRRFKKKIEESGLLDTLLKNADRIELYRPLLRDPKDKRRALAKKKK